MPDTITTAVDFLDRIHAEGVVYIQFTKKDGSTRKMQCTLDFKKIPKADRPKSTNLRKILNDLNQHGLIRVYDMENMGWRSIPVGRVEWMNAPESGKSFKVSIAKRP